EQRLRRVDAQLRLEQGDLGGASRHLAGIGPELHMGHGGPDDLLDHESTSPVAVCAWLARCSHDSGQTHTLQASVAAEISTVPSVTMLPTIAHTPEVGRSGASTRLETKTC